MCTGAWTCTRTRASRWGGCRAETRSSAALAKLSDFVYRKADRVVALGPYMADRIESKGVRAARVSEVPVWSRKDEVYPMPRAGHPLRERLGLADKFVVMYSGNLGLAHSADEFIEAARRLRDRPEVVFLFVGDGPRLKEVRRAKQELGLENVRFLDYFPRKDLHASLSVADVHLVSMRREMTGVVVPGKLYGIMASGRPAIFVGPDHCETADTIREAHCGLTVRLGDADGLVSAIDRLAADPLEAAEMGDRGARGVPRIARARRLLRPVGAIGRRGSSARRRPVSTRVAGLA